MILRRTTRYVLTVLTVLAVIVNAALGMAWYRMPSDTVIVIVYLVASVSVAAAILITVLPREDRS